MAADSDRRELLYSSLRLSLRAYFPFELDDFQLQAIAALNEERSVVVCAPTGSGKTLVGEYAIYRALERGKRVLYTTPLKALSNQKLRDFREQFGGDRVGLLTGDVSINREAPILVMTTEIFRNMLYGTPIGQVGTSMEGVETVVLDECHYMNDQQRGTVWEESIIYCPPTVQLVALSATIANSDQLTDWINQVHGPTELVYSDFRPVPLEFSFCTAKGLFPLLNASKTGLHPDFKAARYKQRQQRSRKDPGKKEKPPETPSMAFVLSQLQQRDMLPAIYFIFSRRGCDKAMQEATAMSLVNSQEAQVLRVLVDEFVGANPDIARTDQVEGLYRGIASHHAGLLPAWKALVEELFQQGLVKVVFATETLAAGINMPARTTVISSLSKRTDQGHRLLFASEFLQMAGRAGRRGMDSQGYVVGVQNRFEGAKEAAYLATVGPDPLVSQFTPSYGMVLNLLQTHTLEQAKDLVERSFGRYLALLTLKPQEAEIASLEEQITQMRSLLDGIDLKQLEQYEKLRGRLREENRLLKVLQQQAEETQHDSLRLALDFAGAGTVLSLKGKHLPFPEPMAAVLVFKVPGSGQVPYLICLGADNRWYVASYIDVIGLHGEVPRITQVDRILPPDTLTQRPGQTRRGDSYTLAIADQLLEIAARGLETLETTLAEEVQGQWARVKAVEAQMAAHPLHGLQKTGNLLKRRDRLESLEMELSDRRTKLNAYTHRHWDEFSALMDILQTFDCLLEDKPTVKPTARGEVVAAIRGDNELWLGIALLSGELNSLDPHHLAAVCEALVTEVSRPDLWSAYEIPGPVEEALEGLRSLRRRLFQVQHRYQVAMPVWLEVELTGLVEQWALGMEWVDLCANTSLDEGDIVRVLRRTLDFLAQIPHVPHLSSELKQNAIRASQLIDRFPVREIVNPLDAEENEWKSGSASTQ